MDVEELRNRFQYHPPADEARPAMHTSVRNQVSAMAVWLNGLLPEGREKAVVMTKLEEVMFWANAAVERQVP